MTPFGVVRLRAAGFFFEVVVVREAEGFFLVAVVALEAEGFLAELRAEEVFGVTFLFGDLAPLFVLRVFAAVERELPPAAFLVVALDREPADRAPPVFEPDEVFFAAVDPPDDEEVLFVEEADDLAPVAFFDAADDVRPPVAFLAPVDFLAVDFAPPVVFFPALDRDDEVDFLADDDREDVVDFFDADFDVDLDPPEVDLFPADFAAVFFVVAIVSSRDQMNFPNRV